MIWLSSKRNILLLVAPALLLYSVFIIAPVFIAGYYSFTDFNGIGAPNFIGFSNYAKMLEDSLFLNSIKNTAIILCIGLVVLLPVSFALSLVFYKDFRGNALVKTMNFAPYIIAPILTGTIWMFILDPQIGLINVILKAVGLGFLQQQWIGGTVLTPYSIGFVYTWQIMGFHATIFLAALRMIPRELFEAADVEGARYLQKVRYIMLPMVKEAVVINTVLVITGGLKIFELVYQMTRGNPAHLSEVMVTYMYHVTFTKSKFGYGMSIAVFVLIVSVIASFFYVRNARRSLRKQSR